jgi:AcrR family transcriptional regulator
MSKQRQPQATARERILDAADELFYYDGIAVTSIDAVVAHAQVAIGSVYNHFGSKDGLVEAYLRRRDHLWRSTWEHAVADAATANDRVLAIFDALLTWCAERGGQRGCAHSAGLQQLPADHPGAAVARNHKKHIRHRLAELASEAGRPHVTDSVVIIYEGALASLMVTNNSRTAITRARQLARATIIATDAPGARD